jgi:hypothetical protein
MEFLLKLFGLLLIYLSPNSSFTNFELAEKPREVLEKGS